MRHRDSAFNIFNIIKKNINKMILTTPYKFHIYTCIQIIQLNFDPSEWDRLTGCDQCAFNLWNYDWWKWKFKLPMHKISTIHMENFEAHKSLISWCTKSFRENCLFRRKSLDSDGNDHGCKTNFKNLFKSWE